MWTATEYSPPGFQAFSNTPLHWVSFGDPCTYPRNSRATAQGINKADRLMPYNWIPKEQGRHCLNTGKAIRFQSKSFNFWLFKCSYHLQCEWGSWAVSVTWIRSCRGHKYSSSSWGFYSLMDRKHCWWASSFLHYDQNLPIFPLCFFLS